MIYVASGCVLKEHKINAYCKINYWSLLAPGITHSPCSLRSMLYALCSLLLALLWRAILHPASQQVDLVLAQLLSILRHCIKPAFVLDSS